MRLFHSKNTKLELLLRKHLFAMGFRYRLHSKELKGHPDIVFPRYKAVIFVHGCFWHAHEGCSCFRVPKTNQAFWLEKFRNNKERDRISIEWLESNGWRVCIVWECAVKRPIYFTFDELLDFICCWLKGGAHSCEIDGGGILPKLELDFEIFKVIRLGIS
ncbi:DNA mismatch endonuclease Vsr [Photobacterium profundum]|uniref:very short patch repair endonuclease n=1 Tax=Photobacterium profundum TaxID=74109 RepID=UPI003D11C40B